jgi:putative ubiquitin-RnfH superfamily antitoxin RatB of RatAB toxin-antitoxin module
MVERDIAHIQLCYALPERVVVIDLDVKVGCTIEEAIHGSGLLAQHPEIDLVKNKIGVYGKLKPLDTVARDGDRIEIYRPLLADPMESRRRRAQHKKKGSQGK